MWKAKIVSKSSVDQSGNIEVVYQILIDDVVTYDQQSVTCTPDGVVERIKARMIELKTKVEAAADLSEGQIIEL